MVDNFIIGAGLAGITLAQKLSEQSESVLIVDKRSHIGGNCYDYYDINGLLIHKYGPHIFHTSYSDVWTYLSRFTTFTDYHHSVLGYVNSKHIPIPFNLDSLKILFPDEIFRKIKFKLVNTFGFGSRITILDLLNKSAELYDKDLKFIADFIFENIFKNYTVKQWGISPEKIDQSVLKRVPVVISHDTSYFSDKYQGMPIHGYTNMFLNMLKSKYISVLLETDYKNLINAFSYKKLYVTCPIDEFFNYKFGKLGYRKTLYDFKTYDEKIFQPAATINFPNSEDFTRITEMKWFYPQNPVFPIKKTTICTEYPGKGDIDAYPIEIDQNKKILSLYVSEGKFLKNTYFFGRLGTYKYMNMDQTVKQVLDFFG